MTEIAEVTETPETAPPSVAENLLDEALLADSGEFAAEMISERPVEKTEAEEEIELEPSETAEAVEGATPKPKQANEIEVAEQPPLPAPVDGMEKADDENVFQPETRRNKVAGRISNRGKSAVNAAETPLGHYTRKVTGAVEKRWHYERRRNADFVSFGSLRVSFSVSADGKTGKLKIHEDDANPVMVDFTLGAILSAEIPPMPKEVRELLGDEPLEITYDVIIY